MATVATTTTTTTNTTTGEEGQAEKSADLHLLPQASINRIIKNKLGAKGNVSKEAKHALTKATGIFISMLTHEAKYSKKSGSMLTRDDVIAGLKEIDFGEFISEIEKILSANHKEIDGPVL